jgi:hypothetical protein
LLPPDLLARMRSHVESVKVQKSRAGPRPQFIPEDQVPTLAGKRPLTQHDGAAEPMMKQPFVPHPHVPTLIAPTPHPGIVPFEEIVRGEMRAIYSELYQGLDYNEVIPLDDIAVLNPQLFEQIRGHAINNAEIIHAQLVQQQPQQVHPRGREPEHVRFVDPAPAQPFIAPLAPQLFAPSAASSSSAGAPGGASTGGGRISVVQMPAPQISSQPKPVPAATSGPSNGRSGGILVTDSRLQSSQPALVNAFVGEAPLKLGIPRMMGLLDRMATMKENILASKSALTPGIKHEDGTVSREAIDFSKLDYSDRVVVDLAGKLQHFLDNIQIPPKLPPILLGLLPLEPSKEFTDREAAAHAARLKQFEANRPKLEMPKFK